MFLIAAMGSLGPFAIDTYLPALPAIGRDLGATPLQMQQTLSAYLFGFAAMNLFHGALADSFGRRPVILGGLALFTLASVWCGSSGEFDGFVTRYPSRGSVASVLRKNCAAPFITG